MVAGVVAPVVVELTGVVAVSDVLLLLVGDGVTGAVNPGGDPGGGPSGAKPLFELVVVVVRADVRADVEEPLVSRPLIVTAL